MTTEGWYLYSVNASKSFNDAKVDWGMDGASTHVYRYIYELNFGASGMPITQGTSLTNNNWLQIDTYTDPMLLPFKAYWVLVTSTDTTAPVITLIGDATVYHKQNTTYTDAGASATDDVNGVVTVTNDSDSQVNTSAEGNYTVTYTASDEAGNTATATRTVIVDGTAPVITLIGDATVYVNIANPTYNELNATADTGETVQIAGDIVDINTADGVYTVTYNCTDASGNVATEVTRTVIVDKTRPVISLNGDATVNVDHNGTYTELSATSDGGETVTIGGPIVNTSVPAQTYTVTYNSTDVAGNTAIEVTRTVIIGPDATSSDMFSFTITNDGSSTGTSTTLSFGYDSTGVNSDIPPLPPSGTWDARISQVWTPPFLTDYISSLGFNGSYTFYFDGTDTPNKATTGEYWIFVNTNDASTFTWDQSVCSQLFSKCTLNNANTSVEEIDMRNNSTISFTDPPGPGSPTKNFYIVCTYA